MASQGLRPIAVTIASYRAGASARATRISQPRPKSSDTQLVK
jgi:hypothetical protein